MEPYPQEESRDEAFTAEQSARRLYDAWLLAPGPDRRQRLLAELFDRFLDPWINQLTVSALRRTGHGDSDPTDQREEIRADVRLTLTAFLTTQREGGGQPIRDLRGYVGSAVYNACFLRLRARSPHRTHLQNRLRYLLGHNSRFALWEGPGGLVAGFAKWRGATSTVPPPEMHFAPAEPAALVEAVFSAAGGPLAFTSLVGIAAELTGTRDSAHAQLEDSYFVRDTMAAAHDTLQDREQLRILWTEVLELPPMQRAALLLNLRDAAGQGAVELIPATGVASFQELASAMGMSAAALAGIWNDLPQDDDAIARQMNITRQQVINLRKSARARLVRRLSPGDGNKEVRSTSKGLTGSVRTVSLRSATMAAKRLFGRGKAL